MPDVKLPIVEAGTTAEETLQNILSVMARYRRELEFLLLHLDADNVLGDKIDISMNPAVNGHAEAITELEGKMTIAETNITQNAEQIQLRATKTDVETLTGRVSSAESTITQHADEIALKVSQTDYNGQTMVSKINLQPESIKIASKNVDIEGKVTAQYIDSLGVTAKKLSVTDPAGTLEKVAIGTDGAGVALPYILIGAGSGGTIDDHLYLNQFGIFKNASGVYFKYRKGDGSIAGITFQNTGTTRIYGDAQFANNVTFDGTVTLSGGVSGLTMTARFA